MLEAAPARGKRGTQRTEWMKNDGASKCHAHAASAGFWLAAACRWRSARRHCSSSRSEQCMRWSAQRRRRLQNDLSLQQSSTSSSPSESRRRSAFYSLARAFQPRASSRRRAGLLLNGHWSLLKSDPETGPQRFESADVGTIPAGDVFIARARRLLEWRWACRHKRPTERKTRRRRIQSALTGRSQLDRDEGPTKWRNYDTRRGENSSHLLICRRSE